MDCGLREGLWARERDCGWDRECGLGGVCRAGIGSVGAE